MKKRVVISAISAAVILTVCGIFANKSRQA